MNTYSPPLSINTVTGLECNWNSVRLPYIFRMARRDGEYSNTFAQPAGLVFFGSNPNFISGPLAVGETFTAVSAVDGSTTKGKVTGILANPAVGNALIQTDVQPSASFAGGAGYVLWDTYENYRFVVELTGDLASGQLNVPLGEVEGTPNSIGLVNIDVRDLLLRAMQKQNYFTYGNSGAPNERDPNGWVKFTAVYYPTYYHARLRQIIEGPRLDMTPFTDRYWYGVDGVKYLQDEYGQNYASHYPDLVTYPAKFLTNFEQPTYFVGYPFSLSFIYNTKLAGQDIVLRELEKVDSETANFDIIDTPISGATPEGVHQVILSGVYDPPTNVVDAALVIPSGPPVQRFVAPTYVAAGYVGGPAPAAAAGSIITEWKRVNINRDCRRDPVYLMWRNNVGGWDYWLFDKLTETEIVTTQGTLVEGYIDYIEAYNLREKLVGVSHLKKVTVGDSVDLATAKAFGELEGTSQAFVLRQNDFTQFPANLNWTGVRIAPKGVKYNNRGNRFDVEVTFLMPETFTLSN